jgi:hypothetical protein
LKTDLEEREFRFELYIWKKSIEMGFNKKIEEIDYNILSSRDKLKRWDREIVFFDHWECKG